MVSNVQIYIWCCWMFHFEGRNEVKSRSCDTDCLGLKAFCYFNPIHTSFSHVKWCVFIELVDFNISGMILFYSNQFNFVFSSTFAVVTLFQKIVSISSTNSCTWSISNVTIKELVHSSVLKEEFDCMTIWKVKRAVRQSMPWISP